MSDNFFKTTPVPVAYENDPNVGYNSQQPVVINQTTVNGEENKIVDQDFATLTTEIIDILTAYSSQNYIPYPTPQWMTGLPHAITSLIKQIQQNGAGFQFLMTVPYFENAEVLNNNSLFISQIDDNLGNDTTQSLYSTTINYALNALVSDSNGHIYKSLIANNLNQSLSDPTKWQKIWHKLSPVIFSNSYNDLIDKPSGAAEKRRIVLSNNSSNPNNQIDFSIGTYTFSDESDTAYNSSIQTGDLNLLFGNGIGMLDTGAKANNTWYYLFAIYNPTTKITRFLASATPSNSNGDYLGANMPSGFTKSKYIGSVLTNGSGNIIPGTWMPEGRFEFATRILTGLSITSAYATYTLNSVPLKSNIVAICNVVMRGDAGQGTGFIYKSLKTLNEKSGFTAPPNTANYSIFEVDLNDLRQFQYYYPTAGAGAPQIFQLYIIGYRDLDLL